MRHKPGIAGHPFRIQAFEFGKGEQVISAEEDPQAAQGGPFHQRGWQCVSQLQVLEPQERGALQIVGGRCADIAAGIALARDIDQRHGGAGMLWRPCVQPVCCGRRALVEGLHAPAIHK